ncbi:MAG: nickel insertion protein, partial [Thermoplasmata archaeon]
MIHIDAREGLSADMVLAAAIGLLPRGDAALALRGISGVASTHGVAFHCAEFEDGGDRGLGISYISRERMLDTVPYDQAFSTLSSMSDALGSRGDVAARILGKIFEAESDAHGLPPEQVHLHEIGRPEALLNIAGIGLVAPMVCPPGDVFVCSTVTAGRGITTTSHGTMRIPAPASAFLLKGLPHIAGDHPGERATPTGLAAAAVLSSGHSDAAPEDPVARSVGFGTKRFAGRLGRV